MAKKNAPPVGPRRTREHVITDLAVNHAERQALLCGYTVERMRYDYGIDLLLFTYDRNGEIESGFIPIQVKATESIGWLVAEPAAAFRIGRKDLVGWLRQTLPVILVVYDVTQNLAYWIHVQNYFETLPGFNLFAAPETIAVHLPQQNVLTPTAVRQFAQMRDLSAGGSAPR